MRGFYAPPYLPPFRPPFSIHILTAEHDLPPATSGDAAQHYELQLLHLICAKYSGVCELSVRQGEFGFLLLVSRDS